MPLLLQLWARRQATLVRVAAARSAPCIFAPARRQSRLAVALRPRAISTQNDSAAAAPLGQAAQHSAASFRDGAVEPVADAAQAPLTGTPGEIKLTRIERELRDLLLAVLKFDGRNDVTLRIAGGWVRNKLLGLESDDIDIVTDGLPGDELASMIQACVCVCACTHVCTFVRLRAIEFFVHDRAVCISSALSL